MPLLIIQGRNDDVVPPIVATRLATHWAAVIDFVDDGLLNGSPELVEKTETVPANSGRHAYTRTALVTPRGQSLIESYLVDGTVPDDGLEC